MFSSDYFIKNLQMQAHPEGGFYKRTFASDQIVERSSLKLNSKSKVTSNTADTRNLWTSIYFLLETGEVSNFHRLKSDEMWYYHSGSSLTIYMISPEGELTTKQLGLNIENGECPQVLVPKGYIFGSAMNNDGYALVGCMVSPGFEFADFELFKRDFLLKKYPDHKETIIKLTRE